MGTQDVPMLKLVVDALGTEVKVRTFDLSVSAYLGGIYLQHMQFKGNARLADNKSGYRVTLYKHFAFIEGVLLVIHKGLTITTTM